MIILYNVPFMDIYVLRKPILTIFQIPLAFYVRATHALNSGVEINGLVM